MLAYEWRGDHSLPCTGLSCDQDGRICVGNLLNFVHCCLIIAAADNFAEIMIG
jgi:hypothetical protein